MNPEEKEQTVDLVRYARMLIRYKWILIAALILSVGLGVWHNSRLTPIYSATATVIIDKESNQSSVTGRRTAYESYISETMTFNTHFELITSRGVMDLVVRKTNLDKIDAEQEKASLAPPHPLKQYLGHFKKNIMLLLGGEEKTPSEPVDRLQSLASMVRGMVMVEPVEDTRLLRLSVTSPDPRRAMEIANSVAESYIEFNIDNRMKSSQNTLAWLTDHLYEIKKKLEDAEEEFLAYKQQAKLISLEGSQKVIAQKISEFNDAYLKARNKRLELDAKLAQLKKATTKESNVPNIRSLIANDLINDLYSLLIKSEVELSRLQKVYKSKHPKIVQAKSNIENTRKKLRGEQKKELANLKAEQVMLSNKERVLKKTMAEFEKEGIENNRKELKYKILKRNVDVNQNLYNTVLARLREADISDNIVVSNIRVTERATLPGSPIGPNKKRNLMLAVVLGLILAAGCCFLKEYLDRTIHNEDEVRDYLGLSVLAVIPLAEKVKKNPNSVVDPKQKDADQEAEQDVIG